MGHNFCKTAHLLAGMLFPKELIIYMKNLDIMESNRASVIQVTSNPLATPYSVLFFLAFLYSYSLAALKDKKKNLNREDS